MKVLNSVGKWMNKNRAIILTGVGLTNCAAATGLAVVGTIKATKAINKFKEANSKKKLTKKDIIKLSYKYYIPSVVTLAGGATLVCLGQATTSKALKAATAAYLGAASELATINAKAPEVIGEKAATKLKEAVAQEKVNDNYDPEKVITTSGGEVLFMEPITGVIFTSSWDKVCQAMAYCNMRATTGSCPFISVSDFFNELGITTTDFLYGIGWDITSGHLIDIASKTAAITNDGKPCCTWEYSYYPSDRI